MQSEGFVFVKGKRYVFRQRVTLGDLIKVQDRVEMNAWLMQEMAKLQKASNGTLSRIRRRFKRWLLLRRAQRIWYQNCKLFFENADRRLKYSELTPAELELILSSFFAFRASDIRPSPGTKEPSGSSLAEEEESVRQKGST